jgi:hypothetical protein
LSEILDIYVQLHQYNDAADGEPLILQLTTRPRFASRLGALLQAAQDGKHISELTYLKQDSPYADEYAPEYDQVSDGHQNDNDDDEHDNGVDPSLHESHDVQEETYQPESTDQNEESINDPSATLDTQGLQGDGSNVEVPAPEGDEAHQVGDGEEDENYFDIFGEDEDAKDITSGGAVQHTDGHPAEHQAPSGEADDNAATAPDDDVLEFEEEPDQPSPSTLRDEHTPLVAQNGQHESSDRKDTGMNSSLLNAEESADDHLLGLEDTKASKPIPSTSGRDAAAAPAAATDEEDFITYEDDDEAEEDPASLKRPRDAADDVSTEETEFKRRRSE